ncbi:glycosyltransferase family 2 protein [Gorillibacterium massiliense]|uniref:glycosyltransferase family 2 protein n=1 Tax=Gorillibacterium massiliense TaxID=1280390 RepID=UPI0009E096E2
MHNTRVVRNSPTKPKRQLRPLLQAGSFTEQKQQVPSIKKLPVSHPAKLVVQPSSDEPFVSVIIPVLNERRTLARVIHQAKRAHPSTEVIVVSNGTTDGSEEIARSLGARVIHFQENLGHDVGRSVGARHALGSILLFIDGDIVIPAAKLSAFVKTVQNGVDIALNRYQGLARTRKVHSAIISKFSLNHLLNRADLKGASMTTIPHAINRKAMDIIGIDNLAVPPKAQAIALTNGLRVEMSAFVDVGNLNPRKRRNIKPDPVAQLIVGDHVEAIRWVLDHIGPRADKPDLDRRIEQVVLT